MKIFGKTPSGHRLTRIQTSPQYKDGRFRNFSITKTLAEGVSYPRMLYDFFNKPKGVSPAHDLPFVKTDLKALPDDKTSIVWFGHSSYLIHINGRNILVDPVFSGYASPIACMVKAFKGANEYAVADFPFIDVLVQTHDHYDHLDYETIMGLKDKIGAVVCTLGVGAHLAYWGIDNEKINELDWWETAEVAGLCFTSAPGRHFSGRGRGEAKTLWGSFVLDAGNQKLFLGGDSGYDSHFKAIGDK